MKKKVKVEIPKEQPVVAQNLDFYSLLNRRTSLPKLPIEMDEAQNKCTANNCITLLSWHKMWKENMIANLAKYKYFDKDHSIKVFLNDCIDSPVICTAAGPSLKKNIQYLKDAQKLGIPIISGAHEFMYLAKEGIKPTYVCLLDSGPEWIEYIKNSPWDDIPLFTTVDITSAYLDEWKGPKYFFRSTFPDDELGETMFIEFTQILKHMVSIMPTGGHTGGLVFSLAHMLLQASEIILVGYDYAYDNVGHFYYGGDCEIDKKSSPHLIGSPLVMATNIMGDDVTTSNSYLGFKIWFDLAILAAAQRPPQKYMDPKGKVRELASPEIIHACEGGILGAYKEGNISWMKYMKLNDALQYVTNKNQYKFSERMKLDDKIKKEAKHG